jgi:hypothetical protein
MEARFNLHNGDFRNDFTIEFNVKNPNFSILEENAQYEMETGTFTNKYAEKCFSEIQKLKYNWIKDYSFAGRSNGWFCLLCNDKEINSIRPSQLGKLETIVERFLKNYGQEIELFYNN